jgi:hypothetical protein
MAWSALSVEFAMMIKRNIAALEKTIEQKSR